MVIYLFGMRWRNTTIIHYFLLAQKVFDIFEKWLWLYGCRSIQSKKEIHSNRKFGSHCFCKIKKPNKNFLKLKCEIYSNQWPDDCTFFPIVIFFSRNWCSFFDMTDSYLRFISTVGLTAVSFFSGLNFFRSAQVEK
jgi:hypothetical protein